MPSNASDSQPRIIPFSPSVCVVSERLEFRLSWWRREGEEGFQEGREEDVEFELEAGGERKV